MYCNVCIYTIFNVLFYALRILLYRVIERHFIKYVHLIHVL